jgi:Fe(II)/alpha-ketoglutarate-dependent arginine beta-hydroxylase
MEAQSTTLEPRSEGILLEAERPEGGRAFTKTALEPGEVREIEAMLDELAARFDRVEDERFLSEASLYAQELPRRLRAVLGEFKLREPASGICILSGLPVGFDRIGKTPSHWKLRSHPSPTLREEMLLVLCGQLLGECIAWATQQDGFLVHDILPIQEHESEQLGTGSNQTLWWHTEDAFHPLAGDYLGMYCLRNPDHVATTYASLEDIGLAAEHLDRLCEPHYTIRPDNSHQVEKRGDRPIAAASLEAAYALIAELSVNPPRIPVLSGSRESPYIRIDPYFMDPVDDPAAQEALDALICAIDERLQDVVLLPGDMCFIDNGKAVHGRRPFKARYDGEDRWLKRVNIARDLRKSRAARSTSDSRTIY